MGLNHLQSLICTYSADDLRLLMRAGIPVEFPLVPWYKSPHRHPERDPDRCPVGISAETCENTGVHSRG